MYQYKTDCPCGKNLGGLGLGPESLIPIAASLFGGGSGGSSGSGGAAAPSNTVSPNIVTQVSPQISPIFQQQFQPSNSAQSAGTSQSLPAMPSLPGVGSGVPTDANGYPPGYNTPQAAIPMPQAVATDYTQYLPYLLGGVGLVVVYKMFGKRKAA